MSYVWYTESVDTSAILLAQALNANHGPIAPIGADVNKIIFYGIVNHGENFMVNKEISFNLPSEGRPTLHKHTLMSSLRALGINTANYVNIKDNSFTTVSEALHTRKIALVSKRAGMTVVNTAENATQFRQATANGHVNYAMKAQPIYSKYRVLCGLPETIPEYILGGLVAEKRQLSFKETLLLDAGEEAKGHVENLFETGALTEDMGVGTEAWSEEKFQTELPANIVSSIKKIQNWASYDFCAFDFVKLVSPGEEKYMVTNATTSPSLQNDDVLQAVAEYFRNLVEFGRNYNKESLIKLVGDFNEDQVKKVAEFIVNQKVLRA